jgi:hypothetical protein
MRRRPEQQISSRRSVSPETSVELGAAAVGITGAYLVERAKVSAQVPPAEGLVGRAKREAEITWRMKRHIGIAVAAAGAALVVGGVLRRNLPHEDPSEHHS